MKKLLLALAVIAAVTGSYALTMPQAVACNTPS
jgi:hypothetical protein